MTKPPFPVRFMGRHPVFGKKRDTKNPDGTIKATKTGLPYLKSPYYWWWYALRLSEAYKAVCEANGKTSNKKLAQVYADFGNVFEEEFNVWWGKNGVRLFAELDSPKRVRAVTADDLDDYREAVASGQTLMIAIPMFLTKREIGSQVRKVVSANHRGAKGKSAISTRREDSQALYPLCHYKGIEPIIRALVVVERRRAGEPLKNLRKSDYEEIAAVSRFERKGKAIIKGVEQGEFPVVKD